MMTIIRWAGALGRLLFSLRYKVDVVNFDQIKRKGSLGILFLPNHPALIDPILLYSFLLKRFTPRVLVDERQGRRFGVGALVKAVNGLPIPDISRVGNKGRDKVVAAMQNLSLSLRKGEDVLLYPGGRVYRSWQEEIGGTSAVHTLLNDNPDLQVVLVRIKGLWGSSFSYAPTGKEPKIANLLGWYLWLLMANFIFFIPRREVSIEFVSTHDLPKKGERNEINRYLSKFYSKVFHHHLYVPYYFWRGESTKYLHEVKQATFSQKAATIADSTRSIVYKYLQDKTGKRKIADGDLLALDLMMDSLARAELVLWLEAEFGFSQSNSDSLRSVEDVLRAAEGEVMASSVGIAITPANAKWFWNKKDNSPVIFEEAATVTEMFLRSFKKWPNKMIIADQKSGPKTYRNIVTSIFALRPFIEKLEGNMVGIMLPASVAGAIVYFATLFSGKTPVMINWTAGIRTIKYALDSLAIKNVITAQALLDKLKDQGLDFSEVEDSFFIMEKLAPKIKLKAKLTALYKTFFCWRELTQVSVSPIGVVLFTSGSEGFPKAVPLTHANQLTNIKGVAEMITFYRSDSFIGFLPTFHSFGIELTTLAPILMGLPVYFSPNPTDANTLAKLIKEYKLAIMAGTPTFVNGIVKASLPGDLDSLRFAVTGAEKCQEYVYEALKESCPNAHILEGYGITECSPVISANTPEDSRPGTIGKVLSNIEYTIVHPENNGPIAKGEMGMLLVRGRSIFGGYLNYDGPSPFVDHDGKSWYKTGDLVQEVNGYLIFKGRLKRFIKMGGEMISLPAIEQVLEKHYPKSEEGPTLAVEATAEEIRPELVLFCITETTREEANRFIQEGGLSPLHNIRRVVKVDTIPVLGTGKIDYRELKNRLESSES
ncbi:MAG: hypothetical protein A2504_11310 [Bdellovibrionales bacterium RIFOXYD12_FULL_39_22]|nr:MAG: hypothetical protein A2385_09875 [Bdellovibrionales bacterium RIFOXYB1_FULL_39_21]OFZ44259.1 MAG: hypothetical protein A2485_07495 [Bdellovibrionales bacterium RIFOXYC12_FULL_39_17]OFZ46801.1 MAG: hypothetical protein A2404_04730 [Bdellovibrionales bacterium RIFOXYC1_FULL_39_130]OFZ75922.1 MAG: hypothetical protein A2560_02420 [Bdellovibrionales bacterium RIFOXYD1_FULL_39_84]OFZ95480.1 MAG: hypothetical protein A2504_11310 [Bdellovibrionales bacterium RIFOXYD12_FULL_39_22]HLE09781.1 AM